MILQDVEKILTVGQLRAALAGIPDDVWVLAEGCDCTGLAGGVSDVENYTAYLFDAKCVKHPAIEIVRL